MREPASETALGGAEVGTAIMPGIGTAIGAAVGFGLGLAADLFGDHGASKARHYNTMTVVPTLMQAMNDLRAAGYRVEMPATEQTLLYLSLPRS